MDHSFIRALRLADKTSRKHRAVFTRLNVNPFRLLLLLPRAAAAAALNAGITTRWLEREDLGSVRLQPLHEWAIKEPPDAFNVSCLG